MIAYVGMIFKPASMLAKTAQSSDSQRCAKRLELESLSLRHVVSTADKTHAADYDFPRSFNAQHVEALVVRLF